MDPQQITSVASVTNAIMTELRKAIVGQDDIVTGLLASLYANGHCLLIGVPGLAKTLLVQSLGASLSMHFNRIQFTPDLMPSDILGSEVIHENQGRMEFQFRQGPVFTNLLLADEINRTPPKTQSALLESMQERRVTIAGQVRPLPQPFLVVATQNPIEQEGTYPLPEAQLDRFMFALELGYPSRAEEIDIVTRTTIGETQSVAPVISAQDVIHIQKIIRAMPVARHIVEYAVDLAKATRPGYDSKIADTYLEWGSGPRASQYLILGAKAFALMDGRTAPEAPDVMKAAPLVLAHRIVPNFRATGEGLKSAAIIQNILAEVKQPSY